MIFSGTLKDTAEPTMTISDANDNVATWQTGTPSLASTVTAPYTLTAYQPVTLAVASTTGFTVNNPVLVGNITADISAIGSVPLPSPRKPPEASWPEPPSSSSA